MEIFLSLLNPLFPPLFGFSYWILTNESSIVKWRAKFLISRLLIGCSFSAIDTHWLHFSYFLGFKLKIKIILRLTKRGDEGGRGDCSQDFGIAPRVLECFQDFGVAPRMLELLPGVWSKM